ncbi:PKD domain-containing protein [Natronospora cellulosivora (SeqCode)]
MKKKFFLTIFILLLLMLIGQVVSAKIVTRRENVSSNTTYDNLTIKRGGELVIRDDITIDVKGKLTIESGGQIRGLVNGDGKNFTIKANEMYLAGSIISRGAGGENGKDGANVGEAGKDAPNNDGINGTNGSKGDDGSSGTSGGRGGHITIDVTNKLLIYSTGRIISRGGNGGDGGDGKKGGKGGNAGYNEWSPPKAGDGGKGGAAGSGANGRFGGNVTINVTEGSLIIKTSGRIETRGGTGGSKGTPGDGGVGGKAGSYGSGTPGAPGNSGSSGNTGNDGNDGRPGQITIRARYFDNNGSILSYRLRDPRSANVYYGYGTLNDKNFDPSPTEHKDEESPNRVTGIDIVNSDGNTIIKNVGGLPDNFISENSFDLIWNETTDRSGTGIPASGVKEYEINISNNSGYNHTRTIEETNLSFSNLSDGYYTVNVRARDYAENSLSANSILEFTIDTHVDDLEPIIDSTNQGGARIIWVEPDDLSGIQGYEFILTDASISSIDNEDDYDISETSEKIVSISALTASEKYRVWVRAIDNLENKGKWVSTEEFSPDSEIITADKVRTSSESVIKDGKAYYSNIITVEEVSDFANLVIEREDANGNWELTAKVDNDGSQTYTVTDNTGLSAHGSYRYKIYTENALGKPSNINNRTITVRNIPLSKQLKHINDNSSFNDININDLCIETPYVTNKENFTIELPEEDIEGDTIKYRLFNENNAPIINGWQEGETTFKLDGDGKYKWYIQARDYYQEGGNDEEGDLIRIPEEDYFTIIRDTTSPEKIEFDIYNPNKCADDGFTNSLEVKLVDLEFEDNIALDRVYIWNEENKPDTFIAYTPGESLSPDNRDSIENLDAGLLIELEGQTKEFEEKVDWILAAGGDGERLVYMEVFDKAENSTRISRSITYDITPPKAPGDFSHNHSKEGEKNKITFDWKVYDEDVAAFTATITIDNNTEDIDNITLTRNNQGIITSGEFTYELPDDISPNFPVDIEIIARDKAANVSETGEYGAYTLAKLGEVVYKDGGYDENIGKDRHHYLKFQLTEPGIAANHELQYGDIENEEFIKSGELELNDINRFLHQELEPRQESSYRLVAYNNSGDPVYGDTFTAQVPNVKPFAAEIKEEHYPQGLRIVIEEDQVVFDYEPAVDVDHDVLEHTVYWAVGEEAIKEDFYSNKEYPLTRSDLIHGQTYTWYVHAQETETEEKYQVESEWVNFIVDTNSPLIEFSEESKEIDFYTNKRHLTVRATDILDSNNPDEVYSDIRKISYEYVGEGETIKQGDITPVEIENTGNWEAKIPLEEGNYTLRVYATDNASNQSDAISMELLVDHTAPEIEEISIDLASDGEKYLTFRNIISLKNVELNDPISANTSSGLYRLEYYFSNQNQERSESYYINIYQGTEYNIDLSDLENGQKYTVVFEAVDRAGNRSEKVEIAGIFLDRTAPDASIDISGYQVYGSNSYLSDLSQLDLVFASSDEESEILEEIFNIYSEESGELVLENWADINTIKTMSLEDGQSYQIAFRAINGVGNETIVYSNSFIYDSTPPLNLSLGISASMYSSGETMIIEATAEDRESPIVEYRLAIGLSPEGKELTSKIYGNQDGYIVLQLNNNQDRILIPEIEDGRYYTTLIVSNAAGLESSISGDNIEINNQIERLIVNDEGPYTSSDNHLSASWQYNGEQEVSGYNYRIKEIDGGYITESKFTTAKELTVEDLDLIHGTGYQFEVVARFIDGGESDKAYSYGVIVDTESPDIIRFTAPEYSISDRIIFEWEAEDEISGIRKVELALGSDYNLTDITGGWVELIDNGLSYDSKGIALSKILETGEQYYPILRVTDGAGNQSDRVATAITIDDEAPPVPIVEINGKYFNPDQPLIIDWSMTELKGRIDPVSGNAAYYWTYARNRDDLGLDNGQLEWYQSSNELKESFENIAELLAGKEELSDGNRLYFAVKVVNGASLENIGISNPLIYDSTAPSRPILRVLAAINLDEGVEEEKEVHFINNYNLENLKLYIHSEDPISLVNSYKYGYALMDEIDEAGRSIYQISDPDNHPRIIDIENPSMTESMIYLFAGESYNQADLVSDTGYSSGIILDNSYPEISFVNGVANDDQLYFNWELEEDSSISNIVRYETVLVTDPTEVPGAEDWQDNGFSRTLLIDASNLDDGTYYLKVRALNAAGNYSRSGVEGEIGISPGILMDRTPPEITSILHPPYTDKEFNFSIEAEDNLSGIASYQYALGSLLNETKYTGTWIEVEKNFDHANLEDRIDGIINTKDIDHREEIYLRARVKDNANLWSDTKRGETILVDHTEPEGVSITGPSHTNTTDRIEGLEIEYDDPESGVTHYRISVATEKEGDWLTEPGFSPIGEYNNLVSELNLDQGEYYLVLEVLNAVGLDTVAYSEEAVIIDTTPPDMIFKGAADEIVFNREDIGETSEIRYQVNEDAYVSFTLRHPNGSLDNDDALRVKGDVEYTYNFSKEAYGTYTLIANVVDLAGNSMENSREQKIRVNQPPVIRFTEIDGIAFSTTPGQEITIEPNEAYDLDGEIVSYLWTDEDDQELSRDSEFVYSNTDTGIYEITLKAIDNNGASTEETTKIEVHNTRSGTLFWHETWSGKHYIEGDIIVPEEYTLTIEAGTEVEVIEGTGGYENQLLINGTLLIGDKEIQDLPISFYLDNSLSGNWQGIFVNGIAEIYNLDIQDAFRAVTAVENAELEINNSIFKNNMIGLHVLGLSPEIRRSQFINNHLYGVKEDAGGRPLMIENLFKNNGMNYYHHQLARYTMDELNNLDGNSGNYED